MPPHAPDSVALRQAIILLDRPAVGRDGHRGRERLPELVQLRATVVGAAPVRCTIESGAVSRATGVAQPTWADLQRAWQALATSVQRKIRAGNTSADDEGMHAVRITCADVPEAAVCSGPGR